MSFVLRLCLFLALASAPLPAFLAAQDTLRVDIEGTLLNAITGIPVAGAEVSLSSDSELILLSDSTGRFRMTDLALGDYWLSITAGGFHPVEGDFQLESAGAFTVRMEPLERPEESVLGLIRGTIRNLESGEPLESAEVSIPALSGAQLTDSHGRFSFRNVPSGRFLMRTEHLGFAVRSDSISIPGGHIVTVELGLSEEPIELAPLSVEAERLFLSLDIAGFYERRDHNSGIFLNRDMIEAKQPLRTTDVFQSLPGVTVISGGGIAGGFEQAVILRSGMRQSLSLSPRSSREVLCGPTVYLDNHLIELGGTSLEGSAEGSVSAYLDRLIEPGAIAGIEIYSSGASAPLQYKGMSSDCGVIVIWTR